MFWDIRLRQIKRFEQRTVRKQRDEVGVTQSSNDRSSLE